MIERRWSLAWRLDTLWGATIVLPFGLTLTYAIINGWFGHKW